MTRRVLFLVASASLLVLAAAISWRGVPAAAAQGSSVTVFMSTEAWYDESPPCVSLIDCSTVPSATPYPVDTLHVSVTAGQETARTYLAFEVPAGGEILGATLTLPLDTAAADGSVAPDTADITACLVTTSFKPVRGSLEKPPPADCHVSSHATYDAKTARFTVNLSPFLSRWTSGAAALALVPTKGAGQPGATWHAVFHATTKTSKTAPPITASVAVSSHRSGGGGGSTPSGPPASSSSGSSGGGSSTASGGGTFTGGGSFPSFPTSTTTTTTTTTSVPQAPAQPGALAPVSLAGFAGPGFAYPVVWALPLLFLLGITAIGRALTKDLSRRGA